MLASIKKIWLIFTLVFRYYSAVNLGLECFNDPSSGFLHIFYELDFVIKILNVEHFITYLYYFFICGHFLIGSKSQLMSGETETKHFSSKNSPISDLILSCLESRDTLLALLARQTHQHIVEHEGFEVSVEGNFKLADDCSYH